MRARHAARSGPHETAVTAIPHDEQAPESPSTAQFKLHEERLVAGTQTRPSGTVRVHKRIVQQERTVTVTVRREELVIEQSDTSTGSAGSVSPDEPLVVVLHEEEPVVTLTARPYETVRIAVERVEESRQVTDTVRREHLDVTDPTARA